MNPLGLFSIPHLEKLFDLGSIEELDLRLGISDLPFKGPCPRNPPGGTNHGWWILLHTGIVTVASSS